MGYFGKGSGIFWGSTFPDHIDSGDHKGDRLSTLKSTFWIYYDYRLWKTKSTIDFPKLNRLSTFKSTIDYQIPIYLPVLEIFEIFFGYLPWVRRLVNAIKQLYGLIVVWEVSLYKQRI